MTTAPNPEWRPGSDSSAPPLLLVDIDGVISLFGFGSDIRPPGSVEWVDGIPHYLSSAAAAHLLALGEHFELIWCSGWEEKANEYLPRVLDLPAALPWIPLDGAPVPAGAGRPHWKLAAIDRHVGADRPLAWVDDDHDERCHAWSRERPGPTLLVTTDPAEGLVGDHVQVLCDWAEQLG